LWISYFSLLTARLIKLVELTLVMPQKTSQEPSAATRIDSETFSGLVVVGSSTTFGRTTGTFWIIAGTVRGR